MRLDWTFAAEIDNFHTVLSTGQDPPDARFKIGTVGDGYDFLVMMRLSNGNLFPGKVSFFRHLSLVGIKLSTNFQPLIIILPHS